MTTIHQNQIKSAPAVVSRVFWHLECWGLKRIDAWGVTFLVCALALVVHHVITVQTLLLLVAITANYWLTDDAISSSSWCYTEGIGYYSKKQVLHGFLDRISKNGNLLLNISPKADGTIPAEQKDILLSMGAWLKKYGEAVYATRAGEEYGEGPTKMGAAHGVFQAPAEGTASDVRFTRSKDNSTLYAVLLGWEKDQKEIILSSLAKDRIDVKSLKSVELINGSAGNYQRLTFIQGSPGLIIRLPERPFEEMAYVLKLTFSDRIPALNK